MTDKEKIHLKKTRTSFGGLISPELQIAPPDFTVKSDAAEVKESAMSEKHEETASPPKAMVQPANALPPPPPPPPQGIDEGLVLPVNAPPPPPPTEK